MEDNALNLTDSLLEIPQTKEIEYSEKGYDLVREMDQEFLGNGKFSSEIKAFMDAMTLKALFFSEDWVFICVDLIANKISRRKLKIWEKKEQDGKDIFEPADNHPLADLLQQPNEKQSYSAWMYNQIVEYILMGNAVIWSSRSSGQLMILPTENVSLNFDDKKKLAAYQMNSPEAMLHQGLTQPSITFKPNEIIHHMRPNPASLYWGLSPWIPGSKSVLFSRYSTDYINSFYLRNALPGFKLQLEKHVNEDVALRLLRSFEQAYTGRRSQRRTLVIPKGVTAEPMSQSIADQNFIDLVNQNRETIINILKIPKHELSLAESGSLGSEEHKVALKNFWYTTLLPTMENIEGNYNKHFSSDLGDNFIIKFDLSDVDALKDDELKKADLAEKMKSTHTLNEIRAKLYDAGPLPGGDATPGVVQQQAQQQQEEETEEEKSLDMDKLDDGDHKEIIDHSSKLMGDQLEQNQDSYVKFILDTFTEWFDMSMDVIKKHLRDTEKVLNEMTIETKAEVDNMDDLEADLQRAYDSVKNKWLDFQVDALSGVVEEAYSVAIAPMIEDINTEALFAIRQRDDKKRRLSLEVRGLESFKSVKDTTATEQVMKVVTRGIKEGKTVDRIAIDIGNKFKDASQGRANTIARTEVFTANTLGKMAATENMVEVYGEAEAKKRMQKKWITARDSRVRSFDKGDSSDHKRLDNITVDIDEDFTTPAGFKLKNPRDPKGPANETINCRCDMIIVPKK